VVSFQLRASFDYKEILRVIGRRKLLIVLPTLVTTVVALVGVTLVEPEYLAVATLAKESQVALTRTVAQASQRGDRASEEARVMLRRIESSSFLESVAVQIGLHEDPGIIARAHKRAANNPDYDANDLLLRECVAILRQMIDVRPEGASVFHIRATSTDPWHAQKVAAAVAEQYLQSTRASTIQQSEEAHTFALEQMAIYEEKVEEKRREIREYEQRVALRPLSSSPVSEANVSRVNSLIAGSEADLEFIRGRHEIIRGQVAEAGLSAFLDLGLISSPKLGALKKTLFELEKHLALAMVEYDDGDPPVASAKSQLAVKSQQVLAEMERLAQTAFPSIVDDYRQLLVDHEYTQISLEATGHRKQQLEDFLQKYAQDLTSMPAEEFHLSRLREELASAENLNQTWLEQANSTQIAKAVQSADVGNPITLLESARVPLTPFKPDKQKVMMLAVMMGIALGMTAAIAAEYFDLTLKSPEEIEATLGVPILGTVPRMQAALLIDHESRRRLRLRLLLVGIGATGLILAVASYWFFVMQRGA
jgi:uncharacterized protein involved in exopolysaccharide biosynthesis